MLKKRTKVLIGVAAGVVVLLLAGAYLTRITVPFRFLEGARVERVRIHSAPSSGLGAGAKTVPLSLHVRYLLPQSCEEVSKSAEAELTVDGWVDTNVWKDLSHNSLFERGSGNQVLVVPFAEGGTRVIVVQKATPFDRFRAWLWKLTHR